jgi:hypothetical protein
MVLMDAKNDLLPMKFCYWKTWGFFLRSVHIEAGGGRREEGDKGWR